MYIQHSFVVPKLQIHVPSFAMLKVELQLNAERCALQKEMLKRQYSVWFCLQPNKKQSIGKIKSQRCKHGMLFPKSRTDQSKTYQDPFHQRVSHVSVWTKKNVRSSVLQADMDVVNLQLQENKQYILKNTR